MDITNFIPEDINILHLINLIIKLHMDNMWQACAKENILQC